MHDCVANENVCHHRHSIKKLHGKMHYERHIFPCFFSSFFFLRKYVDERARRSKITVVVANNSGIMFAADARSANYFLCKNSLPVMKNQGTHRNYNPAVFARNRTRAGTQRDNSNVPRAHMGYPCIPIFHSVGDVRSKPRTLRSPQIRLINETMTRKL